MLNLNTEEIEKKNKIIDDAIIQLKKEFVGIDNQIDHIMTNVRSWFLYPQLQIRPIIINLWGMSGCGKTSLVRAISRCLDIEKDLVYFNFAAIEEMNAWEVEDNIEEQLSDEKSNRIFVYDEFQYAATINEQGMEKDKKSGLKPFWELLDSGIIKKRLAIYRFQIIHKAITYMSKVNSVCPMKIVNGEWVNAEECLGYFDTWDKNNFMSVFNYNDGNKQRAIPCDNVKLKKNSDDSYDVEVCPTVVNDDNRKKDIGNNFFLKKDIVDVILTFARSKKSANKYIAESDIYHDLLKMGYDEIMSFLFELHENVSKGYELCFKDSLIFVIGNLDEAYDMAFNVNPDMSPDQFNKITKKITIVDIKESLQRRFRNEQIARLGNIHVMYPSFSSDSFKKIIDLNLNEYSKDVKELTNLELEYDKSVRDAVYREGVFPTHGTRPIFSTIHEIVKSVLPDVISYINDNGLTKDVSKVVYTYKYNKIVAKYYDENGNQCGTTSIERRLRLDSLRQSTSDEQQALCALHESGHFVVYAKLIGKLPEKLVSKTTDSHTGGFLMENSEECDNLNTKRSMLNNIKISLGGYVAEKMFFGDMDRSAGASADLTRATALAGRMVRDLGFYNNIGVSFAVPSVDKDRYLIKEYEGDGVDELITNIITECSKEVEEIFSDEEWRNMLRLSTNYLSTNTNMPRNKMREIYNTVSEEKRKTELPTDFYRTVVKSI